MPRWIRAAIREVMDNLFLRGEDTIVIGDWNREPDQTPAAEYVATGAYHACDEVVTGALVRPTSIMDDGTEGDTSAMESKKE